MYELCQIRQRGRISDLNLSDEVIERELESDLQKLNSLRAEDLADSNTSISLSTSSSSHEITKSYWFQNVEVSENNDIVTVIFSDNTEIRFEDGWVTKKYPTLDHTKYGPKIKGTYTYSSGSTKHLVNTNNDLICGRKQNIDDNKIESLNMNKDSYNTFCSQCASRYDKSIVTTGADLSLKID